MSYEDWWETSSWKSYQASFPKSYNFRPKKKEKGKAAKSVAAYNACRPRNLTNSFEAELLGSTSAKNIEKESNVGNREKQSALPNTLITLSQNLKDLYIAGKGCDVKFKVKNKSFSAHRSILGARTPVLAAMLTENWLESDTGVVLVEDCDPEAFEIFLIFLYSGMAEDLTAENVMNVYYIADKYQNPELKWECVQYMISNLTINNICDVFNLALRHDEKILEETSSDFFQKNAKEIFNTSEWEAFMGENTSKAKDLIVKYASTH